MKFRFLIVFLLLIHGYFGISQIPDSLVYDWHISGEEKKRMPEKFVNVLSYGLSNDGKSDHTEILQTLISSHSSDSLLIIFFPKGIYRFSKTIFLKANISIQGAGALNTRFIFSNNGIGHLFEISATQKGLSVPVKNGLRHHSNTIEVDNGNAFTPGSYAEFLIDGKGLVTSTWAENSVGQMIVIDSVRDNFLMLSNQLKLDYYKYTNPRIVSVVMITNVHFKYFSIERTDQTSGQTNNFHFHYAAQSSVIGVESKKCNMAHVSFSKSYRCRVADSYFHSAFDYGGGGQAYGIELGNTTGNCRIENNIFDTLRHSILLQSGANGNVISGNYSTNPFWKEGSFPASFAGELVLHGNYPFANLFEGNQIGNIVIDNSHGSNGPGNVFYRNKATLWGVIMNSNAGNNTHFIANELMGAYTILTGTGNRNDYNYSKTTDTSLFNDVKLPASLYVKNKPEWWPSQIEYPALGLPKTKVLKDISAKYRYASDSLKALNSSHEVFILKAKTTDTIQNGIIHVFLESNLEVNVSSVTLEKSDQTSEEWSALSGNLASRFLFQNIKFADSIKVPEIQTCYRWTAIGVGGQTWTSDTFCFGVPQMPVNVHQVTENKLRIYPNPANDFVTISMSRPGEIRFYSIVGNLVYIVASSQLTERIDVSRLPTAQYIVDVVDETGSHKQKLFVTHGE